MDMPDRMDATPEIWLPPSGAGVELDLDNPSHLSYAILNVAQLGELEATRVVEHLVAMGRPYQAARCLEILAQHQLGLDVTGTELLDRGQRGFGAFHAQIHDLLRAGKLYQHAQRPRTADAAFRRALIFVEEALRQLPPVAAGGHSDFWGVGVAFELAGHCCVALDDTSGLEYYQAAETHWSLACRLRPTEIAHFSHHPVTRTVIRCLEPAVAHRDLEPEYREQLFAPDYQTRLDTAKSLLR